MYRLCRSYDPSRSVLNPVPFCLPVRLLPPLRHAVVDHPRLNGRSLIVGGAVFVVGGLLIVAAVLWGGPPYGARYWQGIAVGPLALAFGAFLLVQGSFMRACRTAAFLDGATGAIAIADRARGGWLIWLTGPPTEFRLVLSPVTVELGRLGKWHGWMLSLRTGERFEMALACQKDVVAVEQWLAEAPDWLCHMPVMQGEPGMRRGDLRVR